MKESITTTLVNCDDKIFQIEEFYENRETGKDEMKITIGDKRSDDYQEYIFLTKEEVETIIEKLQFYHSRMEE